MDTKAVSGTHNIFTANAQSELILPLLPLSQAQADSTSSNLVLSNQILFSLKVLSYKPNKLRRLDIDCLLGDMRHVSTAGTLG